MRLEKLQLVNFKNYAEATLDLRGNVHCLLGKNGSGKTNLLEAIHYLALTKGMFPNDAASIKEGQGNFQLRGIFENNSQRMEIACVFSEVEGKRVAENGKDYKRFSEHIGKIPIVLVAPNDIEVIWDGGEIRRKLFDALLSQVDKEYLSSLIEYQSQLRHRNSLLKMFAERGTTDKDLVATYDERIATAGVILHRKRTAFVEEYQPFVTSRYEYLVRGNREQVKIQYQSDLDALDFRRSLQDNFDRDLAAGRTTLGVHRDDYLFEINGHELKRYGSQGQQKSFLIALKLAEFDYLASKNGTKPMILLDDIFDKLDDDRIRRLLELVSSGTFGQIFITDARPERSLSLLKEAGVACQCFLINEGTARLSEA